MISNTVPKNLGCGKPVLPAIDTPGDVCGSVVKLGTRLCAECREKLAHYPVVKEKDVNPYYTYTSDPPQQNQFRASLVRRALKLYHAMLDQEENPDTWTILNERFCEVRNRLCRLYGEQWRKNICLPRKGGN